MPKPVTLAIIALTTVLAAGPAAAFDFGFVRVPDWMDIYILALLIAQVPFRLLVAVTKPRHISIYQVRRNYDSVSRVTWISHKALSLVVYATIAMVLAGIALGWATEAD